MKIIKKLIIFFLVCAMSIGIVACQKEQKEKKGTITQRTVYEGTHINNVADTEKPFITNGTTKYALVVPAKSSQILDAAKNDFSYLFKKATGIDIPIIKDIGLVHNANNTYISLGDNELFRSSGLKVDKDLGFDGYQIFTKDNSYYLVGGYDDGSAYSIYSFFELLFNYETYYSDCVVIDENVKNMTFKELQVKEIPDIKYRSAMTLSEMQYPLNNGEDALYFKNRMKAYHYKSQWQLPVHMDYNMSSSTSYTHSIMWAVPRNTHIATHPDWFAEGGTQLCYTANGNESEFELLAQEIAKKAIFSYISYDKINYPYASIIQFGVSDDYKSCTCDECKKANEFYGTESGAMCILFNRVGEIFTEWEKGTPYTEIFDQSIIRDDGDWMSIDPTKEPERYLREDFKITFFAYNAAIKAPVAYDEATDTYTPLDDKVKLCDKVGVYLANVERDWQQGLFEAEGESERLNIEAWHTLTDTVWFWNYAINFNNLLYFYDCFDALTSEEYAHMAANGAKMIFLELNDHEVSRITAWGNLKAYLHYKLSWNSSLDTNELIENYFAAMYGDAKDVMLNMFYDMRVYTAAAVKKNGDNIKNSIYGSNINTTKYWKKQTLKFWMDQCDVAMQMIETYKDINPEYYESCCGHIMAEYVFPAYAYMALYGNELDAVTMEALSGKLSEITEKYHLQTKN